MWWGKTWELGLCVGSGSIVYDSSGLATSELLKGRGLLKLVSSPSAC